MSRRCGTGSLPTMKPSSAMWISSSASMKRSHGRLTQSQMSRRLPSWEKIWMRLFSRSATRTPPRRSMAMPWGRLNSPGPLPGVPHDVMRRPSAAKRLPRLVFD
jgi:hypothetical protein